MTKKLRFSLVPVLLLLMWLGAPLYSQIEDEHWVVTWTAASAPYTAPPFWQFGNPLQDRVMSTGALQNQTIRMMVHATIGGRKIRIKLSNLFGQTPLRIGAAHVGLFPASLDEPSNGGILEGSDRTLLFNGSPTVTIPAGGTLFSDPADFSVSPAASIGVTLYLPDQTPSATVQSPGVLAAVISGNGDFSNQAEIRGMRFGTHAWLAAVDVLAPSDGGAVVVVSDDSTVGSQPNWPMRLAARLRSNPATANRSVVIQADSNFRYSFVDVGQGVTALDRLDRDVLSQSGLRWIVLAPFVHELEYHARPTNPFPKTLSVEDIGKAFRQIVEKSHAKGVKVVGCTIPPLGMSYGEADRQALNRWIRSSSVFDALIDIDEIMRDPDHLARPRDAFVPGRPHPEFADTIDLSLFIGTH
jgi:hypothetical protein